MKTILQIAITGPFRQTFDYISHTQPPIGSRVKVPFGNREVIGVVISHSDRSLYSEQLKPIIQVIDKATAIPKELLDLIQWTSQYYHHPIGDCFKTALPNHLFTQQTLKVISKTYWQYNQPTSSIRYSQKQQIIIDHLKEKKTVLQSELYQRFNINKAVLKQLEKKGSLISIQNPYL
ncbi:MAG TPA: primosomal protein N', partial [Gammaproteobacteria bacterium]|nr:primosomal protein N' [Gammaproteobacteria bacterium]